jgi:hypothetical protein
MTALLRVGTKVRTTDRGARVHGRAPDKPEAIGTVRDHYRPYGRQSKDRAPPYYVTFESGEAAWYDASEVEPMRGARSSTSTAKTHHATKKPPAQLQREIDEVLARSRTSLAGTAPSSAFEEAKAEEALVEREMSEAQAALNVFPRGPTGLTPDAVKATPEWRAAKARVDKAFARLRAFNAVFVKRFAKKLRAERAERTRERERRGGGR